LSRYLLTKFNLSRPDGQLKPLADHANGRKVSVTMEIYTEVPRPPRATRSASSADGWPLRVVGAGRLPGGRYWESN
jgi:hypothetical protein